MTIQKLTEAGGRVQLPEGSGAIADIRIMGWEPGSDVVEGSSGDYPVTAIVRDFKEAFPVGTRMRANHDGFCEAGGDVRRIMAKTIEAPRRERDGMYARSRIKEGETTDFMRQFADVIGVSVSVGVELEKEVATDEDGDPIYDHEGNPVLVVKKSERGVPIVKRFLSMEESPYNSVDFVEAPGADGRIVSLALESAKHLVEHVSLREAATFAIDTIKPASLAEKDSEATPPRKNKKENQMDEDEVTRIATEAANAAVAAYVEASAPTPAPEQPTLGQTVEAVIAAGLTEAGRSEVYTRLERGESLESAVAAESTREAGIEAEVERRLAERQTAQRESSPFDFGFTSDDTTGKPLGTEGKSGSADALVAEFESAFQEG